MESSYLKRILLYFRIYNAPPQKGFLFVHTSVWIYNIRKNVDVNGWRCLFRPARKGLPESEINRFRLGLFV